jgi:hypothetical protein
MISFVDAQSVARAGTRRVTRALSFLALVAAPLAGGHAQIGSKQYVGTISYTMASPAGDAKDFANDFSWLGFTVEGDWFVRKNISTGFILGWQEIYNETTGEEFTFDNGAVTGRTYKHLGALPILARARYWTGAPGETFHAFAGLGMGTYWMKQTVDVGIYTADENHWHFGLAPEVGFLVKTGYGVGWTVNARYNYPVATGEYLSGTSKSWSYWGIGIGLSYTN